MAQFIIGMSHSFNISTGLIGDGVIAFEDMEANSFVGEFRGDVVAVDEYERRECAGRGGFGIWIKDGYVLDCYDYHRDKRCMMSYVNTARSTWRWEVPKSGIGLIMVKNRNNCIARLNGNRVRLWVGSRRIKCGDELFWPYGGGYKV
jgi:hypothetical protein